MMHIDTDLYDPALVAIKEFYSYVVNNGIILFHDYKDKKWPGITKVVDDFVEEHSWSLVDMNKIFKVPVAAVVNGSSVSYNATIQKRGGL